LDFANLGRWSSTLLMMVTVLVALSPALAQDQTPPTIKAIYVRGNKSLNVDYIVGASGLKVGDPVTQAKLEEARRNLLLTGNFGDKRPDNPEDAVKVTADVDPATGATVNIDVEENDTVLNFSITGSGPIPPSELIPLLQTKPGFLLNLNTLRADVARISDHYASKGYIATVTPDIGIRNGILEIPIEVGKIGEIKISGLHKTRPFVVLREMEGQKSGDYYNTQKLRRAYTRIFNTDLFSDIQPAILTPKPGIVDLTLNMEEKRTGQVGVSVGYSSRNKLIGRAEIGENNLFGRGQQANVMWETGGLANRNSFEVGFTEPWLDRKHTSLSVSLYDRVVYRFGTRIASDPGAPFAGTDTDYYETHAGGQVTVSRPFSDAVRGYVGFRYDNVRVPALSLNVIDAAVLQNGPLATVTLRGTNNTRDYDQDPAAGGFDSATLDIGRADLKPVTVAGQQPSGVFGILNYNKLAVDSRRYFSPRGRREKPSDKRTVFALRLMVGTSTGTLPFSEQYFMGGAESLRGYNEDRFWGSNMFLGSFEFRSPLAPSLTGVVFIDVGDAWGGSYERVRFNDFTQHSGFSPSVGIGIGMRVVTPIGPIRIDQGFGREGAHTHFSIGHVF
jgi:outer membrane protein insertion porin family